MTESNPLKKAFNKIFAGRRESAYLFSFPKCGRTWLRLVLGTILVDHYGIDVEDPMDLAAITASKSSLPRLKVTHDGFPQGELPEELPTSKEKYKDDKVILLVRDPRDVLTSLYFQRKFREQLSPSSEVDTTIPMEMTIGEFLKVRKGGLETIVEYYNIWSRNKNVVKDFMIVRYEDMHTDMCQEVSRIFSFLGIPDVPMSLIREKVEDHSFKKMRTLESSDSLKSFRLRPSDPNRVETFKTRKGVVGDYLEHFNEEEIKFMNDFLASTLSPDFGYRV